MNNQLIGAINYSNRGPKGDKGDPGEVAAGKGLIIDSEGKLEVLIDNETIKINSEGELYSLGSSGTNNYNELINKPKVNGIELSGNKSLTELGIASSSDIANKQDKLTAGNGIIIDSESKISWKYKFTLTGTELNIEEI